MFFTSYSFLLASSSLKSKTKHFLNHILEICGSRPLEEYTPKIQCSLHDYQTCMCFCLHDLSLLFFSWSFFMYSICIFRNYSLWKETSRVWRRRSGCSNPEDIAEYMRDKRTLSQPLPPSPARGTGGRESREWPNRSFRSLISLLPQLLKPLYSPLCASAACHTLSPLPQQRMSPVLTPALDAPQGCHTLRLCASTMPFSLLSCCLCVHHHALSVLPQRGSLYISWILFIFQSQGTMSLWAFWFFLLVPQSLVGIFSFLLPGMKLSPPYSFFSTNTHKTHADT